MYLLRLGSWVLYFFFRPHSGSELSIYPSYDRPAASLRLKNCKIPFTLPPPNLISVLVHVKRTFVDPIPIPEPDYFRPFLYPLPRLSRLTVDIILCPLPRHHAILEKNQNGKRTWFNVKFPLPFLCKPKKYECFNITLIPAPWPKMPGGKGNYSSQWQTNLNWLPL